MYFLIDKHSAVPVSVAAKSPLKRLTVPYSLSAAKQQKIFISFTKKQTTQYVERTTDGQETREKLSARTPY